MMSLFLVPLIASAEGVSFKTARGTIYSAGPMIGITDNASNDIVAAGGNVVISGNAGNEILAAGGSITLSGKTGGDARIAGGNITITNEIGGEAVLAGGKINVLREALIKYDLIAASGDIMIEGTINGGVRIIGGTVTINGTIEKDVNIKAEHLIIGNSAVIKGSLHYEAPREARVEQGAVVTGETIFTQKEFAPPREKMAKFFGVWWVVKLLALMAAALATYSALREKTEQITALAVNRFGHELLTGFIVLIVIPAAVLLLFITVFGSLLGLVIMFFYISLVVLSSVFGALVFTRLLNGYVFKKETFFTWPMILLGVLLYQVIGLIPFLGWIFKFIFFLSGLGALSHLVYSLRGKSMIPESTG